MQLLYVPSWSLARAWVWGFTRTTLRAELEDPASSVSASIVSISVNEWLAPSSVTTNFGLLARWTSLVLEPCHNIHQGSSFHDNTSTLSYNFTKFKFPNNTRTETWRRKWKQHSSNTVVRRWRQQSKLELGGESGLWTILSRTQKKRT